MIGRYLRQCLIVVIRQVAQFDTGEPQPERRRSILRLLPLVRASVIQKYRRGLDGGKCFLEYLQPLQRQFDLL
jgi:hypothetical protein